jgi:hypothetical protein
MKIVIDSQLTIEEALRQNPERVAPDEIIQTLGVLDIEYMSFDGIIHRGQIVICTNVMSEVEAFFKHALEIKFPIAKVVPPSSLDYKWGGDKVLKDNVSVGFDYRPILGKEKLSLHSQGLAFDINPQQNPYVRYDNGSQPVVVPEGAVWGPDRPGTLHAKHSLVKLMEGFGWEWGGHWKPESGRTDYQHFQKTSH